MVPLTELEKDIYCFVLLISGGFAIAALLAPFLIRVLAAYFDWAFNF